MFGLAGTQTPDSTVLFKSNLWIHIPHPPQTPNLSSLFLTNTIWSFCPMRHVLCLPNQTEKLDPSGSQTWDRNIFYFSLFFFLSFLLSKNPNNLVARLVCANQPFLWQQYNFHLKCSIVYTLSTIMYALSFNLGRPKGDIWGNRLFIDKIPIDPITPYQSYKVVRRWPDNLSDNRTREGLMRHCNDHVSAIWKQCVRKDSL
jgi:hypothetical protein